MALSFNIMSIFLLQDQPETCKFLTHKENMLLHTTLSIFNVYSAIYIYIYIYERDTSSLDCKHKHMLLETELHLTNLVSCTVYYIDNSMV